MKKNFEIGDLFVYKYGGIYQLIIDIELSDKLIIQQIGGSCNGRVTICGEHDLRMRYNKLV